ncbi:efflux RND transporter periplasmic adaptor subunit [Roseivirga sp. E12]|uniref:efflux RND transporter periplasmic adaptor subunit n=1 Tax=Roseivirga sp. E12 TaxID=2819237 RepID=UPI001ABC697A|nr:efflux RND transporter periplasmic adaptor subunit [Roseivirga sp. E12]
MKPQNIITFLLIALIAVSCGQSPEGVEGKKARLAEAKAEIKALETEMETLTAEISAEDPDFNKPTETATLITTVPAAKTNFEHKIQIRGNVDSRTNVNVSAEMSGILTAVNVTEGQYIKEGDVMAIIDSDNLQKSIAELETQLDFATTIFEKRDRLWKKNIGTEIDFLQAKNNKEALENQLATLNTQLDKAEIKAPFSGTVEQVPVKRGQLVQPGAPIALLVSSADMYISAEVSESFVGKFKRGDNVTVEIPSLDKSFESSIISVGRVINPASRTFTIEVRLPRVDDYLKTNLVTRISLTDYESEDAIVIPSRIIQEDLKGNFVYLVNGKKASKVHVKLGYSYDNHTEVVQGLAGGETVVDKGNRTVADGTTVSIQN